MWIKIYTRRLGLGICRFSESWSGAVRLTKALAFGSLIPCFKVEEIERDGVGA